MRGVYCIPPRRMALPSKRPDNVTALAISPNRPAPHDHSSELALPATTRSLTPLFPSCRTSIAARCAITTTCRTAGASIARTASAPSTRTSPSSRSRGRCSRRSPASVRRHARPRPNHVINTLIPTCSCALRMMPVEIVVRDYPPGTTLTDPVDTRRASARSTASSSRTARATTRNCRRPCSRPRPQPRTAPTTNRSAERMHRARRVGAAGGRR